MGNAGHNGRPGAFAVSTGFIVSWGGRGPRRKRVVFAFRTYVAAGHGAGAPAARAGGVLPVVDVTEPAADPLQGRRGRGLVRGAQAAGTAAAHPDADTDTNAR